MRIFDGEPICTFLINLDFYHVVKVKRGCVWVEIPASGIKLNDIFETTIERSLSTFKAHSIEKGDDKKSVDINVEPLNEDAK